MVETEGDVWRAKAIIVAAINKGKIDPVLKIHEQLVPIDEAIMDGEVTTLMLVAGKGSASDIAKLMRLGPNINQTDKYGRTALHFACRSGNEETLNELLKAEDLEYDVFTNAGVTPLMMAVESHNI